MESKTNVTTREKVLATPFGEDTLNQFEQIIGKVNFLKKDGAYYVFKEFQHEALNKSGCLSINSLVLFMHGIVVCANAEFNKEREEQRWEEDIIHQENYA